MNNYNRNNIYYAKRICEVDIICYDVYVIATQRNIEVCDIMSVRCSP